jgi:hypothetical protein
MRTCPHVSNRRHILDKHGMSVEDVPPVANTETLKRRLSAHKFPTRWFVGVGRRLETKKRVAGQFAVKYKKEASSWTHTA